MIYLHSTLIVK